MTHEEKVEYLRRLREKKAEGLKDSRLSRAYSTVDSGSQAQSRNDKGNGLMILGKSHRHSPPESEERSREMDIFHLTIG